MSSGQIIITWCMTAASSGLTCTARLAASYLKGKCEPNSPVWSMDITLTILC